MGRAWAEAAMGRAAMARMKAALGIAAESPEPDVAKRRRARTWSKEPDPPAAAFENAFARRPEGNALLIMEKYLRKRLRKVPVFI
jgi:hypothetical protein